MKFIPQYLFMVTYVHPVRNAHGSYRTYAYNLEHAEDLANIRLEEDWCIEGWKVESIEQKTFPPKTYLQEIQERD